MHACGLMSRACVLRPIPMLGIGWSKIRSECFGSSSINYVVRNMVPRQGKMLGKLISGTRKKLKAGSSWMEKPKLGNDSFLKPKETKSPRRVAVLNSVLMEAITDVMASGEFSQELLGIGLEISKVKVTADFSIVNVYWVCPSDVDSEKTEALLLNIAGPLRSHLCRTRVLGNVPFISFVKDRHQGNVNLVEQLLARADFGPDFTPHDHTHHLKSEFIRGQTVPDSSEPLMGKNDADTVDPATTTDALFNLVPTCIADPSVSNPCMRTDILGLKHVDIMQNVMQSVRKAKGEHRKLSTDISELQQEVQSAAALPSRGPALTMSIRQFLAKQNKEKHMSRKEELIDMKNAQFMEQCKQGMNMAEPDEAEDVFCENDFFDEEELLEYVLEDSSDPPC